MLSLSVGVFLVQGTAVRYRVLTLVLRIEVCWFFQNGEMRSQESNYMYSYGGIFLPRDSQITITIIYKIIAIIVSFLETFSR